MLRHHVPPLPRLLNRDIDQNAVRYAYQYFVELEEYMDTLNFLFVDVGIIGMPPNNMIFNRFMRNPRLSGTRSTRLAFVLNQMVDWLERKFQHHVDETDYGDLILAARWLLDDTLTKVRELQQRVRTIPSLQHTEPLFQDAIRRMSHLYFDYRQWWSRPLTAPTA